MEEFDKDYTDLLNTVQRHTKCNSAYCLKTDKNGDQYCRFNFPVEKNESTHVKFEKLKTKNGESNFRASIVSKRNDPRVNRHQRLQLQAWRANCDIQLILDHHACIEYLAKYASKGENMSSVVRDAFVSVVNKLTDESDPKVAVRKLLIKMMKAVGERDMSMQEVMHQILSLKLFSSSFNVITVSLDGSRKCKVENNVLTTEPSTLDYYAERMNYCPQSEVEFLNMNFIGFVSNYTIVKDELRKHKSQVIVRTIPNYSANPNGINYAKFCKYQLIKYRPWQNKPSSAWENEEESDITYILHWQRFLETDTGKMLVPNWHRELQNSESYMTDTSNELSQGDCEGEREEWMYLAEMARQDKVSKETRTDNSDIDLQDYLNSFKFAYSRADIAAMPFWIERQKSVCETTYPILERNIDISSFNNAQRLAYNLVATHNSTSDIPQLLMIITGQAGSGKSYVIDALRDLLHASCIVCSYFGIAAFNVKGHTLHSIFQLPIRGKRNSDLKGDSLQRLQLSLHGVKYIIIDEFSVIGQKLFGWLDRRCRQATGQIDEPFGGLSVILVGDIAQLPPVGDKVLYHCKPQGEVALQGFCAYKKFKIVVKLRDNQRASGQSEEQFRSLQIRLRDGASTPEDWKLLLSRSAHLFSPSYLEKYRVKLAFGNNTVAEHNYEQLKKVGFPIITLKAIHNNNKASRLPADEFGGLEPILHICEGAHVMLTRNLWTEKGLCNGTMGVVREVIFKDQDLPPALPVAIIVQFNAYTGPTFGPAYQIDHEHYVPIVPITSQSDIHGSAFERQQFPLKLCWAITIHKSQGLTIDKAWIDLGCQEKSAGLSYVAISRVRRLDDFVIEPMSYERLLAIRRTSNFIFRCEEEVRLDQIDTKVHDCFDNGITPDLLKAFLNS